MKTREEVMPIMDTISVELTPGEAALIESLRGAPEVHPNQDAIDARQISIKDFDARYDEAIEIAQQNFEKAVEEARTIHALALEKLQ